MNPTLNTYTIGRAGLALGRYFMERAHRTHKDIGIGYTPADDAPNTFEALRAEVNQCLTHRRPVRVWSGGSDATIYGSAEANYAFRFIHDLGHFSTGLGFAFAHEVALSRLQGADIIRRFGADSLEALLYQVDTEGQSVHADIVAGCFPVDQSRFVFEVAQRVLKGLPLRNSVRLYTLDH